SKATFSPCWVRSVKPAHAAGGSARRDAQPADLAGFRRVRYRGGRRGSCCILPIAVKLMGDRGDAFEVNEHQPIAALAMLHYENRIGGFERFGEIATNRAGNVMNQFRHAAFERQSQETIL